VPTRPQGVDKTMRLRRRRDFLAVQRSGATVHGRAFLAVVAPGPGREVGRVGVTVTRKVGNAVTRNRIKRLVREWLRRTGWVPAGCDVVIIAKPAAAALPGLAAAGADLDRLRARLSC
jgi:ribonuclease P protein component